MNGAFGLIYRNNKSEILLVKRRDIPIWVLPGGALGKDSPEDGVIREVFEETGFIVNTKRKVGEYSYENSNKLNYTFICNIKGGEKTLSDESKEIEYFSVTSLPKMISPYATKMIQDGLIRRPKLIKRNLKKLPISFWFRGMLHPWAFFKFLLTKFGIHWNT